MLDRSLMNPNVFVSHAGEDENRFVLEFAEKLRENGVNAWVDEWEILPGDSMVDKIFEEGIGEADAVVVVLSENSVDKKWVREELNASVIRRINQGSKLIPVVIDECEVPEVLKATNWVKVDDLNSFDDSLNRVLRAIYEERDRPPLGQPPEYAISEASLNVSELTDLENAALEALVRTAAELFPQVLPRGQARNTLKDLELGGQMVDDTLTILRDRGFIDAVDTLSREGSGVAFQGIAHLGWKRYAQGAVSDYRSGLRRVAAEVANSKTEDSKELSEELNMPHWLTAHYIRELGHQNLIEFHETASSGVIVGRKKAELRRWLRLQD
jgi:hypothetical protein